MNEEQIKELCSSVYGYTPKRVVPFQQTLNFEIATAFSPTSAIELENPVLIESFHFAHAKKVAGMENYISLGVTASTSKSMQVYQNNSMKMLAKFIKVTSSQTGEVDLTIFGWKCVL